MLNNLSIKDNWLIQIFENAAYGMCIVDNDYRIIATNNKLASLLGINKEDFLGKKCCEIIPLPFCNTMECPLDIIKRGADYYNYETEYSVNNRSFPFLVTATPLLDFEKKLEGMVLSYRDITDLLKYRQELKEAKEKAEEENMLKTKFLANISHEIRTPMNGIIGLVELIGETDLNELQKEYIDMLKFSGERLLSIINDVLDISKIESGKLECFYDKFNFARLLDNISNHFKYLANKKGLEFRYRPDNKIPNFLIGDSDKLSQILFNLLSNAIKFTDNGYVGFYTYSYIDCDYVNIKFEIEDTGIGITNEKVEELFESFHQLDLISAKKYEGTGLGLAITKELVKLMGGEIQVSSILGEGSTFTVELQFSKADDLNEEAKYLIDNHNSQRKQSYTNLNILVVEDDSINQRIIKTILEKNNWNVTMSSNGVKALEYLEYNDFDLILLDINMPDIDGFEVARIIRKREALNGFFTPIIALTAASTLEDRNKCMEVGMNDFISKPVKPKTICEVIMDVLEKEEVYLKKSINISQLLDRLDGDTILLKEIIEEVLSEDYEKEFIGNIKLHIEKENFSELKKLIHKFDGSICNFGADIILDLLGQMKEAIDIQNNIKLEQLFKKLEIEFIKFKNILKKINKRTTYQK